MSDKKAHSLPAGISEADLKKLVLQHGPLIPIRVMKDGATHTGLFKRPTLTMLSASAATGSNDPVKGLEVLYNTCKVKVDPAMDEDDEVRFAAMKSVNGLFRVLEGEVGEAYV
jgi:hypothetical protein